MNGTFYCAEAQPGWHYHSTVALDPADCAVLCRSVGLPDRPGGYPILRMEFTAESVAFEPEARAAYKSMCRAAEANAPRLGSAS